ncbi:MAG TPA: glycosyltransferase family 39 protein [Baekduia sp.]|uniref:glycosyltransferase family 39 protein n=1 Tax=Baekduia sp. TaxID=2600305 RepID=UPI002D7A3449|nr:glycosyltransferase family 39 protein [Baekduia sp.]HET6507469.1 glycosyltransferase family 39 protein [Baekduia sp.]
MTPGRVALGGVLVVAAALRAVALGATPLDPFYDAAVRTMGGSWHAFLTGAIDPSGQVSVDKPPVDLWLQVASTKVVGFNTVGLLLPSVIGGVVAVLLLYDLVRTLAGPRAALIAAAALAVLPIDVITARSDTMDGVMSALILGALAVTARGARDGRPSRVVIGGALMGLAFEVKLFEALLGFIPLAVLWLAGAHDVPWRRRVLALGGAGAAFVAVGLAWLVTLTLAVPASQRPWAFGSSDGSAWSATFVYDGWQRLTGAALPTASGAVGHGTVPAPPGPLRLLSGQDGMLGRLGLELALAWGLVLVLLARRRDRFGPGLSPGLLALGAWLLVGTVLFSVQAGFRPRYAEAFVGAIAGVIGIAAARLGGRGVLIATVVVLAASAGVAAAAVGDHVEDSGTLGAMPPARLASLDDYLRAHQAGARYEAADVAVTKAAALITRSGEPQLILDADRGQTLVPPSALARAVARGEVRYAVSGGSCRVVVASDACSPDARWIRAHGTDVSRAAGQPYGGVVYRLGVGHGG